MSKVLITESHLSNIGNAIRSKLGVVTTYKPGEMPAAIMSIPSVHGTKTVTSNGTYKASDYGLDGFSEFTVNVEGGSSAGRCARASPVSQFNYGELLSTMSWTCTATGQTE